MKQAWMPADVRDAAGLMDGLVRLAVGIEQEADLRRDVDLALAKVARS